MKLQKANLKIIITDNEDDLVEDYTTKEINSADLIIIDGVAFEHETRSVEDLDFIRDLYQHNSVPALTMCMENYRGDDYYEIIEQVVCENHPKYKEE